MPTKSFLRLSFLLLFLLSGSAINPDKPAFQLKTIVLDAGHGGKDPGTHGKISKEKDVALSVVLKIGKFIKEKYPDVRIIYTRQKDEFIELHERAAIANRNKADLFISVHCNSGPSHACGSETYAMGLHTSEGNLNVAKRENSVVLKEENYLKKYEGFDPSSPMAHIFFANIQNAYLDQSLSLASKIEKHFSSLDGKKSRGVKQAGFLVLWKTAMPAILIELGYLTHAKEEKSLSSKDGQEKLARSVLKAVSRYKEDLEGKN